MWVGVRKDLKYWMINAKYHYNTMEYCFLWHLSSKNDFVKICCRIISRILFVIVWYTTQCKSYTVGVNNKAFWSYGAFKFRSSIAGAILCVSNLPDWARSKPTGDDCISFEWYCCKKLWKVRIDCKVLRSIDILLIFIGRFFTNDLLVFMNFRSHARILLVC